MSDIKINRFVVQAWVCDYGIYDINKHSFVGTPIESYREAEIICKWFNDLNTWKRKKSVILASYAERNAMKAE